MPFNPPGHASLIGHNLPLHAIPRSAPLGFAPLRSAGHAWLRWAAAFAPLVAAVVRPGVSGLTCYGGGRGSPVVFLLVESHLASPSPTLSRGRDCHIVAACLRQAPNIKRFAVSAAVLCCLRLRCLQSLAAMEPLRMRGRRVSDLVLSLQIVRLVVALQLASLAQQVAKGGHRAGRSVEGCAPSLFHLSADVSVRILPTSGGAKGRAAQRYQGLLGIVEPQRRVAALPRRALIGRRCGRRSMRFGAASGLTLGPTTVTFLRVTTHHQCRRADGRRAPAATAAKGPASW